MWESSKMSTKQDWKSIVSIVQREANLQNLLKGRKVGNKNRIAWLILKAAREQNNATFIHHTEVLLLRRLTFDNYREFVSKGLLHGSWEFKLVLLRVFEQYRRSVHFLVKAPKTLNLIRQLLESFVEETRSRFGLEVDPSAEDWDTYAATTIKE